MDRSQLVDAKPLDFCSLIVRALIERISIFFETEALRKEVWNVLTVHVSCHLFLSSFCLTKNLSPLVSYRDARAFFRMFFSFFFFIND